MTLPEHATEVTRLVSLAQLGNAYLQAKWVFERGMHSYIQHLLQIGTLYLSDVGNTKKYETDVGGLTQTALHPLTMELKKLTYM